MKKYDISIVKFQENIRSLEEFNIELPSEVISCTLIMIDTCRNFLVADKGNATVDPNFIIELGNSILTAGEDGLCLITYYGKKWSGVINDILRSIGFIHIKNYNKLFIDDYGIFVRANRVGNVLCRKMVDSVINSNEDLSYCALRFNSPMNLTNHLHRIRKPVSMIVTEYIHYLGANVELLGNQQEWRDAFNLYAPRNLDEELELGKDCFVKWYIKQIAK